MDNMQFAKHMCDIQEVMENLTEDAIDNLVRNVVAYASSNNNCKTNWIAFELLTDVISEEKIAEIFNEE